MDAQSQQGGAYSFRSVAENRFTGINHDYIRDDSHAFILREPSRCIDCGRCAQVCAEIVGAKPDADERIQNFLRRGVQDDSALARKQQRPARGIRGYEDFRDRLS